ncbi:HNH endonuclease signature motif containing protein [Chondromyces crocatus]|uniref:HNH nuclease domain-containing protein n=1 Tax=Chondromyces crocatus TaxID=52 RepID=A0A0K1EHU0_CHOCO|nr:HNH endonuclease signature motif containing protein [Chondromyces crocatus]AKT40143.1 uncharacterized protein CMC5_042960 [Chondromyces crocatus]
MLPDAKRMRLTQLFFAIGLFACACGGSTHDGLTAIEQSLSSSERSASRTDETYSLTEGDLVLMQHMAVDLLERGDRIALDLAAAQDAYHRAAAAYGAASGAFEESARNYRIAADRYREVTAIIIVAAGSDLFLRGVCGRAMSTSKYRKTLQKEGVDLKGKDIDHIIPRSRGGLDMPWNYNPLDASINRSLKANGMWWKLTNFPLTTLNALAKHATQLLLC